MSRSGPNQRPPREGGQASSSRPRHWLEVCTPGLLQHKWDDGSAVSIRDPSVSFEDARLTALAAAHMASLGAQDAFDELRRLMIASNPLQFFLLIDALQRLMRRRGVDAYGYDPLQELVGGVLTSIDPDVVMSRRHVPISEDEFAAMEFLVRQLAGLAFQASAGDYLSDIDERAVDTRFLLVAEERFDRTAGYPELLRVIAFDVLVQLDDLAPTIGFRLSDALRGAEAHLQDQLTRLKTVHDALGPADRRPRHLYSSLDRLACISRHDPVHAVAAALKIDAVAATRLLEALATPLGSQSVTSLTRGNRLRHFPVIKLLDGTFIWASPHDFVHEVLEWAALCLIDGRHESAKARLSNARARTAERLTVRALANVYGEDRVIPNVEYCNSDGDWVETDAVVTLGTAVVIVEAKSQRMTPQGRSGAAGRVRTKVDEFLVRPLSQTARAARELLGGCEIRHRSRSNLRLHPTVVRRLIVNLDRVDPFVTHARDLVNHTSEGEKGIYTDAWIVCLADLLLATHVLRTPTELWAYHGKRVAQTEAGSPTINSETDALGAWLESREGAWPTREGHELQLAYSSREINAYFSEREQRRLAAGGGTMPAPSSEIPQVVLDTMTALIENPAWAYASDAIAEVPPAEWARLRRDLRRLDRAPTSRRQRQSFDAVLQGVAYGTKPEVTINVGGEPRLTLVSANDLTPVTEVDPARPLGEPGVALTLSRSVLSSEPPTGSRDAGATRTGDRRDSQAAGFAAAANPTA